MILLIDNYDSFAHNLARYVERLGHNVQIIRNDKISIADIQHLKPEAIILSPGPCGPTEAGICNDVIAALGDMTPILGVCLGHQCIAESYGSAVVRTPPVHGKASIVYHEETRLFAGIPSPFKAGRYHSLMVELDILGPLNVTAKSDDGIIMALEHAYYPVYGVQFHPESILTENGGTLIENFLSLAFAWNAKKKAA